MKKFLTVIAVILIALFCAVPVLAEETVSQTTDEEPDVFYPTGAEESEGNTFAQLWELWVKSGSVPDDIGGLSVYSTGYDPSKPNVLPGEHYVIYVLYGTGEERKNELRALCGDADVEFAECKYSYNRLAAIMSEIKAEYTVYEAGSDDYMIFYMGIVSDDGLGFVVSVHICEKYYAEIASGLTEEYGDAVSAVSVSPDDKIYTAQTDVGEEIIVSPKPGSGNALFIVAIIALPLLCMCAAMFFVFRARRACTLVTPNGETQSVSSLRLSAKEIENKVAESARTPSEHVYDDIMKKL